MSKTAVSQYSRVHDPLNALVKLLAEQAVRDHLPAEQSENQTVTSNHSNPVIHNQRKAG